MVFGDRYKSVKRRTTARWRDLSPRLQDVIIVAVVFANTSWPEGASEYFDAQGASAVAWAAATSLPLIWRRRHATIVAIAIAAVNVGEISAGFSEEILGLIVAVYSLGVYSTSRPRSLIAIALAAGLVAAKAPWSPDTSYWLSDIVILLAIWITGDFVGRVRNERIETQRHAEAEAQARAQTIVEHERAQLARELHDVIAHALGVVVVQATSAAEYVHQDPDRAAIALTNMRDTGKDALGEMRRLLTVLRASVPNDISSQRLPQPNVANIPRLAAVAQASNLDLDIDIDNTLHTLSDGTQLSIYRICQEAITNTIRHADATNATLNIRTNRDDSIRIVITDNGVGIDKDQHHKHGLTGIIERASLYGGTVTMTTPPGGGTRLDVTLQPSGQHLPHSSITR